MKPLVFFFLVLVLATSACGLEFNPPPLSLTPPAGEATNSPVLIPATPTFTVVPPSPTLPAPTETLLPPTATETQVPPTATAASPVLTVEQLRNLTLNLPGADGNLRSITLKDGKYEDGTDPAQPGYIRVNMGEKTAFGDLNADQALDAALTIAENYGGSGVFVSVVAVLNQNGQPNAVASAFIEDRPMINDLAIQSGEIFLDATIHGPNDPSCCPAMPSARTYHLDGDSLTISRLSTKTPDGAERSIQVETPINGTEISGPFVIKGTVSISPFENTLSYKVFQQDSKEPVDQAGFTISADGLGGPGTFELPLDLSANAYKGPVRIEISDVSPADGSSLAVYTLYLVLK